MNLSLYRAHWEQVKDAIAEGFPKALPRIEQALKEQEGNVVSVEGESKGFRAIADLMPDSLKDVANCIRLICCAADVRPDCLTFE